MKKDSKTKAPAVSESKTYQTMLGELDDIVRAVGQDQLDLDEIVGKIERGYQLIATMRQRLDTTKAKVEKLRVDFEANKDIGPGQRANTPPPSKDTSQVSDEAESEDDDLPF